MNSGKQNDFLIKFRSAGEISLSAPHQNWQHFPGNLNVITVNEAAKSTALQELVSGGVEITGVELIKPSLEEIFYKIKTQ